MKHDADTTRRSFIQTSLAGTAGVALGLSAGSLSVAAGGQKVSRTAGKKLKILSRLPRNAEPALPELVKSWITPLEQFYIRSHAPVPKIDLKEFRITVEGLVNKPLTLSLKELSGRFKTMSVIATMTCAGNRRSEHSRVKKVAGVQWSEGAIGNARWGGVRLSDVLKFAGIKSEAKHVWFEGIDQINRKNGVIPFGASIPLLKAMSDTAAIPGTLLCTEMNGKALLPDHGSPLRTVVPGYIGARSVKWLGRIIVSNRSSSNHYVDGAYKLVPENSPLHWQEAGPIYPYVLNSVICTPVAGAELPGKTVRVSGYALPPGRAKRTIARVEVSADGGRRWQKATLTAPTREYCWQLWSVVIPLRGSTDRLIVRAVDSAGTTQPQSVKWNVKGYLYNAWHHVPVKVR